MTQAINNGDLAALLSILFILFSGLLHFFLNSSKVIQSIKGSQEEVPWSERLQKGLAASRSQVWGRLGSFFGEGGLSEAQIEEIEELLYSSDLGPDAAGELIQEINEKAKIPDFNQQQFKSFLFNFLESKMLASQNKVDLDLYKFDSSKKGQTKVIMIVGVNGAGKNYDCWKTRHETDWSGG